MHRFEVSIQDVWIPDFIEIMESSSIDDLNTNDITRAASMFVNLKINYINEILINFS